MRRPARAALARARQATHAPAQRCRLRAAGDGRLDPARPPRADGRDLALLARARGTGVHRRGGPLPVDRAGHRCAGGRPGGRDRVARGPRRDRRRRTRSPLRGPARVRRGRGTSWPGRDLSGQLRAGRAVSSGAGRPPQAGADLRGGPRPAACLHHHQALGRRRGAGRPASRGGALGILGQLAGELPQNVERTSPDGWPDTVRRYAFGPR